MLFDDPTINYTHIVPGRRLIVTFVPQAWIGDYAVDIDGTETFDATEPYLRLTPRERAKLKDNSEESRKVVPESLILRHNGPHRIEIETAIEAFHSPDDGEIVQEKASYPGKIELPPAFSLEIPEEAWKETGTLEDPGARLELKRPLTIADISMHLQAFAIDEDGHASDDNYDRQIQALHVFLAHPVVTSLHVRKQEYTIVAYPA